MGRNLYILAATLLLFALALLRRAYTNIAQQPGSPGDVSLWRTMGLGLFVLSLVVALAGVLSSLFEQAERRAERDQRPSATPNSGRGRHSPILIQPWFTLTRILPLKTVQSN